MYYSDDVIEEVRSRNDIVDVISSYVKLKRQGANYFGLCPFHSEKSASFSVSPSKQIYYCFGCGAGGNVISFIMQYENYTFPEAVQYLAQRAGMELPEQDYSQEERQKRDVNTQLRNVQKMAATYYYYQLRSPAGAPGMKYFRDRQLSDETMKSFGLGYAGKYSDRLYRYMKSKNIPDSILKQSGLFIIDKERMTDKFWNRVIFPIMDVNNRVIGFGGRVMGDGKPKYLNSPETPVFDKSRNMYGLNIARRTHRKYLIVCEGYMDVISMHQAGFTNAVASLGTSLTQEHCRLLKRYTDEVILSYDSDGAGIKAGLRAIPMVKAAGLKARVLHLEPYKDPDEFIKAMGAEEFEKRLENAENSFHFEMKQLEKQYDMKDPEDKTRFFRKVADKIAGFDMEVERDNYIDAFAAEYNISVSGLKSMVRKAILAGTAEKDELKDKDEENSEKPLALESRRSRENKRERGIVRSEGLLLTWLTEYPGFYKTLKKYVQPEDFSTPITRELAGMLYEQLEKGEARPAVIIDHYTEQEQQAQAVRFFNTRVKLNSESEIMQAMRETIYKVMESSIMARDSDTQTDFARIMARVSEKKQLEETLPGETFDLSGGDERIES